jgi:hypothetical protein
MRSSTNGHSSRNKKRSQISRKPTIFFRGVMVVHFFAAEMSAQTECKRQLQTAKGRCKAMLWYIIPPGNHRVSLFPGSLDGTKVSCGLWVSMGTFSFATAFAEIRRTFAKNPLQINLKIHTLNRVWVCCTTWLTALGSILSYSVNSIQKVLTSHLENRTIYIYK